jgi:hypothetical protein
MKLRPYQAPRRQPKINDMIYPPGSRQGGGNVWIGGIMMNVPQPSSGPAVSPTPTPTTTTTPTVTPSPVWPNLCLIVSYGTVSYGPFQFVISGSQNGRPQWTSGNMVLGWSTRNARWEIQGWTTSTGLPVSTNPTNIPTSSWAIAGGTGTQPQISMTQGTCPSYLPLLTNVVVTNTSCSGTLNCNGSISVTTGGGVPPYSYSINNGASYQSSNVFNGLCQGTYTVITNDSLGNSQTQVVILGFDSAPTSYTINASLDRIETISNNTHNAKAFAEEKTLKMRIPRDPEQEESLKYPSHRLACEYRCGRARSESFRSPPAFAKNT